MATRPRTLTINKPTGDDSAEERHAGESDHKRPGNLPSVKVAQEGFSLYVDGKTKRHFDDVKAATEYGLALKRAFPVVQVAVFDAAKKVRTLIELPGGAPAQAGVGSSVGPIDE